MPAPKTLIISALIAVRDAYCAATGESLAAVSKQCLGRGGQFRSLEIGERDFGTLTLTRAAGWFWTHWPDGLEWPKEAEWLRLYAVEDPAAAPTHDAMEAAE